MLHDKRFSDIMRDQHPGLVRRSTTLGTLIILRSSTVETPAAHSLKMSHVRL